jgi:hypothetical protein
MVLGGDSTRDKGLAPIMVWEEGRKCLLSTCNTRKVIKPFLAVK